MDVKSIHESAHCITAILLGIEFGDVTIETRVDKILINDDQGGLARITSPNVAIKNFDKLTKEQKIILAISGSVAEAILTKSLMNNFPIKKFQIDFTITDKAKEFLMSRNIDDYRLYSEIAGSDKNIDQDIAATIALITHNWEKVIKVAQHLEENKTSSYRVIKKIVE